MFYFEGEPFSSFTTTVWVVSEHLQTNRKTTGYHGNRLVTKAVTGWFLVQRRLCHWCRPARLRCLHEPLVNLPSAHFINTVLMKWCSQALVSGLTEENTEYILGKTVLLDWDMCFIKADIHANLSKAATISWFIPQRSSHLWPRRYYRLLSILVNSLTHSSEWKACRWVYL